MSYFDTKIMQQIQVWLGLCPRPYWGSLQHSPRCPSWIQGVQLFRLGERKKWRERTKWKKRKRGRKGQWGRRGEEAGGSAPPIFQTRHKHTFRPQM